MSGTSDRRDCLRRLMRDAPPSLHAFARSLRQMLLRAARDHRSDRCHSQLRRFLDAPLHVVELENGNDQRDGQRGIGLDLRRSD